MEANRPDWGRGGGNCCSPGWGLNQSGGCEIGEKWDVYNKM